MSEKPLIPASDLTRRRFCEAAGVGAIVIALPACFGDGGGSRAITTGGVDDLDAGVAALPDFAREGEPPDFAGSQHIPDLAGTNQPFPDMAQQKLPPDMSQSQQNTCPGGYYDTKKAPGGFAINTATYFSSQDVFVCRDANGLYALTSICPHAGCTVNFKANGTSFHCPCHGANFNFTGGAPTQPAHQPLEHYAICLQNNGDVGFDTNSVVGTNVRLNA